MAKQFDSFTEDHIGFVAEQPIFFVGTAAATGHVNVSPKGMDSLRILSPDRLVWLNLTGSGSETSGHLAQVNRMTVMWCGFGTRPMILRAYGTARCVWNGDADWDALAVHFPAHPGARQVFDMAVTLVQSSCGYAVPYMEPAGDRPTLTAWAEDKGPDGLRRYWADKNAVTIDGFPTGLPQ